jgi:protein TonB
VLASVLASPASGFSSESRKLKTKVAPTYPELARSMNIAGTVKIEIVIAPDGKVKATRPLGGHPLLIRAATDALKGWRYEPGPETTMVIEFHFNK